MHLVVIAWLYVALMMAVAEATNTTGTVLGAVFTFLLYGVGAGGTGGLPDGDAGAAPCASGSAKRPSARPRSGRRALQPRQTQAAKRPLTRSRRCEKNRNGLVHGAPGVAAVVAVDAARRRARAGAGAPGPADRPATCRRAGGLEASRGLGVALASKAALTSSPTSKASGPMQGPSQAMQLAALAALGLEALRRVARQHARRPGRASRHARRPRAARCVGEQHRQAVGHHDRAGHAARRWCMQASAAAPSGVAASSVQHAACHAPAAGTPAARRWPRAAARRLAAHVAPARRRRGRRGSGSA